MSNRLALGTVQFGLRYGIANRTGQVAHDEVVSILECASSAGVDMLDTAILYGDSEQRLGEIGVGQWHVVSKLPPIPDDCCDVAGWVEESVAGSLGRLGITRLHGLLLHRSRQLLEERGAAVYDALVALRDAGKVRKIGVSIYDPEELDALWPRYRFDLVQAPFNIVDRRLATSGWLTRLHEDGTEVHVRSVFLQGLLLMNACERPAKFGRWQPLWNEWQRWLDEEALTPLQACLRFAGSWLEIDRIVVGTDSTTQLQEILAGMSSSAVEFPMALTSLDPDLINPSRWNAL